MNQPLNYRNLVAVAKIFGWQEEPRRGRGSHRCLVRPGYRPIALKCHGESTEYQRGMTRKYLKEILQPLNDAGHPEVKVLQVQLEEFLAQLEEQLQKNYYQFLEKCENEASDRIQNNIDQKLDETEHIIAALVAEQVGIEVEAIQIMQQEQG